ncbi:MAG: ATP synthase F0 subunit B [Deltaproteobacteria bacterium]|nr:ATP synthase F0 subunit B [Deltaproteobacteria bacterium]
MVSMTIDWSVLVQMANFLILMLVLNIIFYKPLKKFISSRQELMEGLKSKAEAAKELLAVGEAQQERFRIEVLQEGVNTLNTLKAEGRSRELEILTESQNKAAQRIEASRQAIGQQVEEARVKLQSEAQVLASQLADKLLGRIGEELN